MSALQWLFARMQEWPEGAAVVTGESVTDYAALMRRVTELKLWLQERGIESGESVCICADFSPDSIALLLAAWDNSLIAALQAPTPMAVQEDYAAIAGTAHLIWFDHTSNMCHSVKEQKATHPLLQSLADAGHPGLILFSSGSTGTPKASVHDVGRFLGKFQQQHSV